MTRPGKKNKPEKEENVVAGEEQQETKTTAPVAGGGGSVDNPTVDPVINLPGVAVTVDLIRSSYTDPVEDNRLIKMKVSYPENFKGKKYMKDGDLIAVSPESAERFEKLGLAKKIEV